MGQQGGDERHRVRVHGRRGEPVGDHQGEVAGRAGNAFESRARGGVQLAAVIGAPQVGGAVRGLARHLDGRQAERGETVDKRCCIERRPHRIARPRVRESQRQPPPRGSEPPLRPSATRAGARRAPPPIPGRSAPAPSSGASPGPGRRPGGGGGGGGGAIATTPRVGREAPAAPREARRGVRGKRNPRSAWGAGAGARAGARAGGGAAAGGGGGGGGGGGAAVRRFP